MSEQSERVGLNDKLCTDMTISMQTFEDENGQFGVQVIVSGLENNEQADRAVAYLQSLICGKEMTVN